MSVVETIETFRKALGDGDGESKEAEREEKKYVDVKKEHELAHLKTIQDNNEARKDYSEKLFGLTCVWLAVVLLIVVFKGMYLLDLSDAVLITLITTTTANVLGFFILVIRYLFNPGKST